MALSVTYTNFDNELVCEYRGGVQSLHVPDTLGSTAQLWDTTGTKTDEWTYWPYGEVRTRTGTTKTPFTFVGTLGYYLDILGSLIYVRARHLRQALARWQTVDPLWPLARPYAYVDDNVSGAVDTSGRDRCDACLTLCIALVAIALAVTLALLAIFLGLALLACAPPFTPACLLLILLIAIFTVLVGLVAAIDTMCCFRSWCCCENDSSCCITFPFPCFTTFNVPGCGGIGV